MKKTKIICSIGPSSYVEDTMRKMIQNGMNVVRINFSHADMEERKRTEDLVHYFNDKENANIAILFDTKGPDLRTCAFEGDYIELVEGEKIRLVKDYILGTREKITFNYPKIIDQLTTGIEILLDDGLVRLRVDDTDDEGATCTVLTSATIKSRRGVNIPNIKLDIPFISEEDEKDIRYACEHDGDFLGISFVSTARDVEAVRELLRKYGKPDMPIITKVETAQAIDNIDEIIDASDAIMVARGDLGVEVPMEELPLLQKLMIQKCREKGKICIVATEMLASMETSSRPTRAEVSDVANAVLDGCDAVMLSGETTIGRYPAEAVKFMADIAENAEKYYDYDYDFESHRHINVTETIAKSVIDSAKLLDVKVIVAATMSGYSAKIISNLKPNSFILAACPTKAVARSLALNWGVYPAIVPVYNSTDEVVSDAKVKAQDFTKLNPGDYIVVTGGFPNNTQVKTTNFMKIEEI